MEELSFQELLIKELSEFVEKNRKALKDAEQWLGEFDGNLGDAWNFAKNALSVDWRKIVLVAKRAWDIGPECFLDTILSEPRNYSTREHPNIYLIRNALEEGKKAVAEQKAKPKKSRLQPPDEDEIQFYQLIHSVDGLGRSGKQLRLAMEGKLHRSVRPDEVTRWQQHIEKWEKQNGPL